MNDSTKKVETQSKKWTIKPLKWRTSKSGKAPYQGYFYPGNSEKYEGDKNNIIFRSGLELRLFKYLDSRSSVLKWSSEETVIPYISPKDNKLHRYFVDAKVIYQKNNGETSTYLIEVKPFIQCSPPVRPKKQTRKNGARYLKESVVFSVNTAKWNAAETLCKKMGWHFIKMTEKDLKV